MVKCISFIDCDIVNQVIGGVFFHNTLNYTFQVVAESCQ